MSIDYLNWAFQRKIKPSALKFVLVSMADFSNEYGESYPTVETLSNKTGLDRKTVMKHVNTLIESGIISDTGRRYGKKQQTRVYKIDMSADYPSYKDHESITVKIDPQGKSTNNGTPNKESQISQERVPLLNSKSTVFDNKESQKRYTEPSSNHQLKPSVTSSPKGDCEDVLKIFDYWKTVMKKNEATKLTDKRKRKIKSVLKDYDGKAICLAIKGCSLSKWHMGDNPTKTKYNDLINIFKDDGVIERFIDKATKPVEPDVLELPKSDEALIRFAADNGLKPAKTGDSWQQFRRQLENEIRRGVAA